MATARSPDNAIAQFEPGKTSVNDLDPDRDRTIYFVTQALDTSGLYAQIFDDGSLSTPTYVGEAKKRTTAAILEQDGQQTIFSLREDGVIQDHRINDDFEWEKGTLEKLDVKPRENTAFTAIYGIGKIRLYVQNNGGVLQELVLDDASKQWQPSAIIKGTKAAVGEGISAVGTREEIAVFYANEDLSVHKALYRKGQWEDTVVPATKEETTAPILVTAYSPSPGFYTLQYTNAKDEVYEVENSQRTLIGKIADEKYEPKTNAQHGGWVWIPPCHCCCRCRRRIRICICIYY